MLELWGMGNLFHPHTWHMLLIMTEIVTQYLFGSKEDAIGSIANYLSIHGWNAEADIVLKNRS